MRDVRKESDPTRASSNTSDPYTLLWHAQFVDDMYLDWENHQQQQTTQKSAMGCAGAVLRFQATWGAYNATLMGEYSICSTAGGSALCQEATDNRRAMEDRVGDAYLNMEDACW